MFSNPSSGLFLITAFVVPGFIIYYIRSKFTTGRMERANRILIELIALGAINFALWSWLLVIWITFDEANTTTWLSVLTSLLVVVLSPIALGILAGYDTQHGWSERAFRRIGLHPVHPVPAAWDYVFPRIDRANWILITFHDGSFVGGFFGPKSFASSDPAERDIYIEQVFNVKEDGNWEMGPSGKGILIKDQDIAYIELISVGGGEDGKE